MIVAIKKAGISRSAGLAKMQLATPLGASAAYFGSSFLKQSHVDTQLVNVAPSAIVAAMQQGNVRAVSIFLPFQQQVVSALGSDAIVLKPEGPRISRPRVDGNVEFTRGNAEATAVDERCLHAPVNRQVSDASMSPPTIALAGTAGRLLGW